MLCLLIYVLRSCALHADCVPRSHALLCVFCVPYLLSCVLDSLIVLSCIYCKWADLFPSSYSPTCRSVVAFPLFEFSSYSPTCSPLVLCHSKALSDASFNIISKLFHLRPYYHQQLSFTCFRHLLYGFSPYHLHLYMVVFWALTVWLQGPYKPGCTPIMYSYNVQP